MSERIVVTGMGIVSALGAGTKATLAALEAGRSGIAPITYLQTEHANLPAGEVPYSDAELRTMLGINTQSPLTRTALLGRLALREALAQANLLTNQVRTAFVSGTTVGGMDQTERYYNDFLAGKDVPDIAFDCGSTTQDIADLVGNFDVETTPSTACSSATNALIAGANMLRTHQVQAAVVGASECLSKFHLNGFNSLMILDSQPCRPFDRDRAGLNLGEGAAYLVLENETDARQRGARPLCTLSGYANACDAFHQTASSPNGEGGYQSMAQALAMAGLRPTDIDYVNAHGTGTPNNDLTEGTALMRLFGQQMPAVSSTKGYTGHATSAAGGLEAVIAVLALLNDLVPCNLNFTHKMDELDFEPVRESRHQKLRHVLSNSFGFGGNDSACIFSKM